MLQEGSGCSKIQLLYPLEASGGYSGLAFAYREIFGVNALRGKLHQLGFCKFAGYLHWEVGFSGTEISLILKNKMAATGISLKIIYLFLLAGSNR